MKCHVFYVTVCSYSQTSSYTLPQQLHWHPIEYCINFTMANITFRTLYSSQPDYLHPAFIILLVLSGCQTPICSLFRLFAVHLVPAAFVLQLLKFETHQDSKTKKKTTHNSAVGTQLELQTKFLTQKKQHNRGGRNE